MKKLALLIFIFILYISVFGQKSLLVQSIVDEGKNLYYSEMASKYGSDVLLDKYPEKNDQIADCFSYSENKITKCVFISNEINPKIIATISFDSTFDIKSALIDKTERAFTVLENNIYKIKKQAIVEINSGIMFITYKNSSLHIIPLINGNSRKVYVITVPNQNGIVYFGNDYLLTFDVNNKLKSKRILHRYVSPIDYAHYPSSRNKVGVSSMHSHCAEEGELITSTDICIIMMNEKNANWANHTIMADNKVSIWNCETNTLAVMSKSDFEKSNQSSEKRKRKTNLLYN